MTTQLVLDALEQAIWTRAPRRAGRSDRAGRTTATAASQYTSLAYTERLAEAGIAALGRLRRRRYDNALAETINGLYKTELIKPSGHGGPSTTSRSPPPNGSTGSTTAASTSTAATSHRPSSRPLTTLNNQTPADR